MLVAVLEVTDNWTLFNETDISPVKFVPSIVMVPPDKSAKALVTSGGWGFSAPASMVNTTLHIRNGVSTRSHWLI
jgi:hypothetical protein